MVELGATSCEITLDIEELQGGSREKQQRKKEVWSMNRKVITISRQCGSGGHTIGKMVAEQLKIPFYDKKLMEIISERSGFSMEVIEQQGEYVPTSLLYSLATNFADKWALRQKGMTLPDQIYAYQKELIQELANAESCVIVGRCADFILRNHPECFHVFVYGDLENRKNRIISEHGIAAEDAKEHILDRDKKRSQHYNYYTGRVWGKVENYDICLNSSYYGVEDCVRIILSGK